MQQTCRACPHAPQCRATENKWRVRFFKIALLLLIENCNKAGVGELIHTHTQTYIHIVQIVA